MWDEITYPFSNFNGDTVEVCEWISNFTPHFIGLWLLIHARVRVGFFSVVVGSCHQPPDLPKNKTWLPHHMWVMINPLKKWHFDGWGTIKKLWPPGLLDKLSIVVCGLLITTTYTHSYCITNTWDYFTWLSQLIHRTLLYFQKESTKQYSSFGLK